MPQRIRPTRSIRPAHRPRARRAFSLLEILIVIFIILALGGLVVVNLLPAREGAIADLQRADFDGIHNAMNRFRLDLNRWPTEEEGLAALWNRSALEDERDQQRWKGPYLENPARTDRWGNAIVYRNPSTIREGGQFYDLVSFGPDGQEGTDDDITNHDRLRNADGEIDGDFDDFTP